MPVSPPLAFTPSPYTVHAWSPSSLTGAGQQVAAFPTEEAAKAWALAHAYDYEGGLYICWPDGTVDTGDGLLTPEGERSSKTKGNSSIP